jgi:predicted RND superfamily exporter protein
MNVGGESNNQNDVELLLHNLNNTIERLKAEYTLFFAGEIRVPPEQERERLEKKMRNLVSGGSRNPRIALLIQNVSSKFSLYNNMWLKRLNEQESGIVRSRKKPVIYKDVEKKKPPMKSSVDVSLNSEESFEKFYENYKKMSLLQSEKLVNKEKMINSIKSKLITANIVDVKIELHIEKGKVKLKLKKKKFV